MGMGNYAQLLFSACRFGKHGMPSGNGHIHGIFFKAFSRVLCAEKIEKEFLCFL
jgi:hypothetical protein